MSSNEMEPQKQAELGQPPQQQAAAAPAAAPAEAAADGQEGEGWHNHDRSPQPSSPAEATEGGVSSLPDCYLIVHNVAKKHNIGTLARCATAFNVKQVCLVGSRQFNTFGAHGSSDYVHFRHFPTLEECVRDLKEARGCTIVGVEIQEGALPVHRFPFTGNTAFMLGNEGQGLTDRQMSLCDSFVYIQQYGVGTASLNVAVAASIVLHHFALWAGYAERQREGHKFVVDDRPARTAPRGFVPLTPEEQAAERVRRQQAAADGDGDAAALPALFDE